MSALMSDTVNHLFMWDNTRVWHYGGDAIKALNENFYDPQTGVHWIQTNWEVIHLMPVQAKCQSFEAEDRVTQMNSDLKLVFLYFIIHGGERGISLCKHEPCVDVNVIRVRAVSQYHSWIFILALYIRCEQMSFHIFFNFSYFLLKYSYFTFTVV